MPAAVAGPGGPPRAVQIRYHPLPYRPAVRTWLPRGFVLRRSAAEGDTEYAYRYADAAVFYICSFPTPHSYAEIRQAQAFYAKQHAQRTGQELVLAGRDSAGFYWQDRTVHGLSIGFYHASPARAIELERSMALLKIKK